MLVRYDFPAVCTYLGLMGLLKDPQANVFKGMRYVPLQYFLIKKLAISLGNILEKSTFELPAPDTFASLEATGGMARA